MCIGITHGRGAYPGKEEDDDNTTKNFKNTMGDTENPAEEKTQTNLEMDGWKSEDSITIIKMTRVHSQKLEGT